MNDMANTPDVARFPGRSVQDTIAADGDVALQPPAYRKTEFRHLGDAPLTFDRYVSRDWQKAEIEKVWPRTWQWACREEHVAEAGDYYVYDVGPYSIIVTRTEQDEIKAYHNSCLHRGTKLKPSNTEGSGSKFVCPFHGWTWNLEGELIKVPCAWDFPHMQGDKARLPEAKVARWGGFVFINMDPGAVPFEEYAYPLLDYAGHAELENRYVALHLQKELNCNWKIAQEAFFESYHGSTVHPQTLASNSVSNGQYDVLGDHLGRMFLNSAIAEPDTGVIEQQDMLEGFLGDAVAGSELSVPEGSTARQVVAGFFRQYLAGSATDFSKTSISELIDNVGYMLFPNGSFFMSPVFGQTHRVRPLGDDPAKCLFELVILRPLPKGDRPYPAEPMRLKHDETYASVPGIDVGLATVYDQDTCNMAWQQEGMAASAARQGYLANYQEVLIRHSEQTMDRYMAR